MSGSVDERVVEMQFKGSSFASGIQAAVEAIGKLKSGLNGLKGSENDINNLDSAGKKFSLSSLSNGVSGVASKFSLMRIAGLTAFSTLVRQALYSGEHILAAFTIDPIKAGLASYEVKINAIQTILANTASEGTNLAQVTNALNQLNQYSNLTVFNFADMAKNIGTFTAAGVKLNVAVSSIKGIANLAALSGSSAQQASTAMYQLSQAIAAGRVKLQDWNSVVNAGIGGKVFQTALINTARAMGISIDAIIKKAGSFRQSLQTGWITSAVLTNTLAQFTGDLSNAQLKAMGFTAAESAAIQKQAQIAVTSATQIRTISQLVDALKDDVSTAWAAVFEAIIGNFKEAPKTLTALFNTLSSAIIGPIYALARFLTEWNNLGGRASLIEGIITLWRDLSLILDAAGKAFAKVFPPQVIKTVLTATQGFERLGSSFKTVKDSTTPVNNGLYNITQSFEKFTKDLTPSKQTLTDLEGIFSVVFGVLKVGVSVFKAIITIAGQLAPAFRKIFPPAVVTTTQTVSQGFEKLGGALEKIQYKTVEDGFTKITTALQKFATNLKPSQKTLTDFRTIFEGVFSAVKLVITIFADLFDALLKIGGAASGTAGTAGGGFLALLATIASWITDVSKAVESGNALKKFFDGLATAIAVPLGALGDLGKGLGDVVDDIKKFIQKVVTEIAKLGPAIASGFASGNFANVVNVLNEGIFASILLYVRNFIKNFGKKVEEGGEKPGLFDTIKESFEGLTGVLKQMQTELKAQTLEKIAIAVAILTVSIIGLSFVNVQNLTKALSAITILFTEMLSALAIVAKISGSKGIVKMAVVSAALNLLATAVLILTGAVAILAQFSWEQLAKGLSAIAILLGELVGAMALFSDDAAGKLASAYAMEVMATALNLMSFAVAKLGKLSWSTLEKGVGTIAALLLILAGFQEISGGSEGLVASGAGMLLVSAGLLIMSKALKSMGSLSWGQIGKSLTVLSVSLLLISAALYAMEDGLAGAAALIVTAAALVILSKALKSMGNMSWGAIGKSLTELAGALLIIAAATTGMIVALPGAAALLVVAAALAVITPILITLGKLSWTEIAKGLTALAGVFLVIGLAAVGLGIIAPILILVAAAVLVLGVGVLSAGAGVVLFAAGLTALAIAIAASGGAILSFVKSTLSIIPTIGKEFGLALVAFAQALSTGGPALIGAFSAIFSSLDKAIIKNIPGAEQAFQKLLDAFLTIISKDAGPVARTFGTLIVTILTTIAQYAPRIASAGGTVLVSFLTGIRNEVPKVATAGANVIIAFVQAVAAQSLRVTRAAANAILTFITGLTATIKTDAPKFHQAGIDLASAIVEGIAEGIGGAPAVTLVENAAKALANSIPGWVKKVLGINSPAKVMIPLGLSVPEGLGVGMIGGISHIQSAAVVLANAAMQSLKTSLASIGTLASTSIDLNPKITPVVDLTQAKQGFSALAGMSKSQLINAGVSTTSALSISAANASAAAQAGLLQTAGTTLQFNQNNYSPVALSAADIYRRTKNQISVAKGVLQGANPGGSN